MPPERPRTRARFGPLDIGAARDALASEPTLRALGRLASLIMPETVAQLGALDEALPELVDEMNRQAADVVRKEAGALDRELASSFAGAIDDLLTAAKKRAPKSRRLPPKKKKR